MYVCSHSVCIRSVCAVQSVCFVLSEWARAWVWCFVHHSSWFDRVSVYVAICAHVLRGFVFLDRIIQYMYNERKSIKFRTAVSIMAPRL